MKFKLVDEENFSQAVTVYTASWRESHKDICSREFIKNRDYAGYLQDKLGSLYLIFDQEPVGVFCLQGTLLQDLYIHPSHMGRGYGTACLRFAAEKAGSVRLTVLSTNHRAIGLYEKNGFRFTGNDIHLRDGLLEREMIYTEKCNG